MNQAASYWNNFVTDDIVDNSCVSALTLIILLIQEAVQFGVSQRSVLGPLLFVFFTDALLRVRLNRRKHTSCVLA